ncbi:MAG: glycerol-3-phosphate acyltransferase [Oscillospiraceae bacterium]|nr:glycerol-3-phosphate acyltransferase [Oscillospiraceae bacterium]
MWFAMFIVAMTGYFLGNLNGAVSISTSLENDDVRKHGSGNAGLTNFFRSYGSWRTLLVLLVDAGKTVLSCLAGKLILQPFGYGQEGAMLGAVAVSLGHDFPALLGFRGGKGIVCGFAVALVIDWRIALMILAVFVTVFAITRYVSLGSVLGALIFGVGFCVFYAGQPWVMAGGIFLAVLAVFMHRSNIARLMKGTEKKVHLIHREMNKE